MVDDPVGLLREAGNAALQVSGSLHNMVTDEMIDSGSEAQHDAIAILQDAAQQIRRQALWLLGEADIREKHSTT
jgi:hypothetical protein